MDNPDVTVYFAVGTVVGSPDGPDGLGSTFSAFNQKKDGTKETIPFTKALVKDNNSDGSLDEFINVEFDATDKKSFLVVIDAKRYAKKDLDFYEDKKGGGVKGGAKAVGHELGAHVENAPEAYSGEGHTKYGENGYSGKYGTGSGKAKEKNEQINKVRNGEYKKELKLKPTDNNGTYKIEK